MKNFLVSVKIKVFLGYITLVILASLIVWVIYSEVLQLSGRRTDFNPSNNKFIYVNTILTNLYQAEGLERNYSQTGQAKPYNDYLNLMNTIGLQIDTLAQMVNNPIQQIHTDSIKKLLRVKQQSVKELYEIKKTNSSTTRYREGLKKIPSIKEPIKHYSKVYKKIVNNRDSIYIKEKKRKFFERLTDVFSSQKKRDSILHVVSTQSVKIDSLLDKANPADSIAGFLTSIITEIRDESVVVETRLKQKEQEVLANDRIISAQLRQMLSDIEKEELYNSFQKVREQQNRVEKATVLIILIGSLALIAIIFFLVNILNDITKSQHYRQNLEEAKAFSDSLLKSKEQFMLSLTHDLKSPLNSIIGFTGFMEQDDDVVSPRHQKYLQNINTASRHILKLINDLLDLARLETGKLTIDHITFNLERLVDDIVEGFLLQAQQKNIDLQLVLDIRTFQIYRGDPVRITQILGNLISNALKFTEEGTVTVHVSVTNTSEQTDWIKIDVTDTGIGISKEDANLIFHEFTRVSNDKKQYEGTGLGLTITQKIVNLLKGTIELESEPGKGSHFTVLLPLEIAGQTSVEVDQLQKKNSLIPSGNLTGKRIWLIDDDQTLLEMTTMILKTAGADVRSFNDPQKAINAYKAGSADILITDYQMPGLNGVEVLRQIQEINGSPITSIAISGRADSEYNFSEFSAFIQKPFEAQALISLVLGQTLTPEVEKVTVSEIAEKNGYNLEQFAAFAAGDPESLKQILISFLNSGQQNLMLFGQAIQEENKYAISELSHKMLTLFRQLQANNVVEILAQLETKDFEHIDHSYYLQLAQSAFRKIEKILQTIRTEENIDLINI
jgi:signal transduction histidine kinase/FixJ family two-component response regulator